MYCSYMQKKINTKDEKLKLILDYLKIMDLVHDGAFADHCR